MEQSFGDQVSHVSAGELLRIEQATKPPSEWSKLITSHLDAGLIVPVHITLSLLRAAALSSPKSIILIDGFPRNWDNISGWNEAVSPSEAIVEAVIFIDTPRAELLSRIMGRAAYSGRDDDNESAFNRRFELFESDTMQIVSHFEERGLLVRINGSNSKHQVYEDVKNSFIKLGLLGNVSTTLVSNGCDNSSCSS